MNTKFEYSLSIYVGGSAASPITKLVTGTEIIKSERPIEVNDVHDSLIVQLMEANKHPELECSTQIRRLDITKITDGE